MRTSPAISFDSGSSRWERSRVHACLAGFLAVMLAAFSASGCAKIGDPQPPEVRIPIPATDLSARQVSDFILLTVSKPAKNTNGSEVTTLRSVDVLRLAETGSEADPPPAVPQDRFIREATRVLSIHSSRFSEYLRDGVFVIQDPWLAEPSPAPSRAFRYAVLFVNRKNQSAGLSNQVVIRPVAIPPAPEGLSAEVTQNSITLKWAAPAQNADGSKPPRVAGYNIFKSENPGQFPASPLNPEPVPAPEFADHNFRFGADYYYAVSTVASLRNPRAESLPSKAVSVHTEDVFPPAPPLDFNALLQEGTVVLLWAPSPSADVAGYRIFRKEKGTAGRRPVEAALISGLSYRDSQLQPGKEYEYAITAVDTYGNESPEVTAEVEKR